METLTIGTINCDVQVDNMYEPWSSDRPNNHLFKFKKEGTEIYLRGLFSDGAEKI
jgi:hypothetical protein